MGEDGRKKRQFFTSRHHGSGKRRRVFELRGNSCGILFTVGSPMRMRDGMHELMALLDDICAAPAVEKTKETNPSAEDGSTPDVTKALAQELQELKQEKGVGYCQFVNLDKTPNDLAYNILRRLDAARGRVSSTNGDTEDNIPTDNSATTTRALGSKKSKKLCCRFLNRLIPVDAACAPHPPNLYRVAQTLIASYFPESEVARAPDQFANDLIRVGLSAEQESDKVAQPEKVPPQNTVPQAESPQRASDPSMRCEGVPEANTTQSGHHNDTNEDHETHSREGVQAPEVNAASPTFEFSAPFQVPKGGTWCLKFQKRGGMTTIDRDELISKIGAYVGPNYTVNLSSPDFTILVENLPVRLSVCPDFIDADYAPVKSYKIGDCGLVVASFQAFCGMSVVRDYVSLCHYNAHRLCFPESYEHNAKDAQTQKTQTSTLSETEKLAAETSPPTDSF